MPGSVFATEASLVLFFSLTSSCSSPPQCFIMFDMVLPIDVHHSYLKKNLYGFQLFFLQVWYFSIFRKAALQCLLYTCFSVCISSSNWCYFAANELELSYLLEGFIVNVNVVQIKIIMQVCIDTNDSNV